jgi:hypothetical protein
MNQRITSVGLALVLSIASMATFAAKDSLPNGKPFQNLQEQIDVLALDVETLNISINARVDTLQGEVDDLAAQVEENTNDISAIEAHQIVQDELIATLQVGVRLLSIKVRENSADIAAIEAYNTLQDRYRAQLAEKLRLAEIRITENEGDITDLYEADQLMQGAIAELERDLRNLTSLVGSNYTQLSGRIDQVANDLADAKAVLATKQTRVSNYCNYGSSIRRIYSTGTVSCETDDAVAGLTGATFRTYSETLSRTRLCVLDVVTCLDYEYHSSGGVYCPSGYSMTGGGFDMNGRTSDILVQDSYPSGNGYYARTKQGDDTGYSTVYVRCIKFSSS